MQTSPANWWQLDTNVTVDFSNPRGWDKIGVPFKAGNEAEGAATGCHLTNSKESWPMSRCWERRGEYYPMTVRLTVLATPLGHNHRGLDIQEFAEDGVLPDNQTILIMDDTVTMTEEYESSGSFFEFVELEQYGSNATRGHVTLPKTWPDNFMSPLDYFHGLWHFRFEILEQPSMAPTKLQFCIWDLVPHEAETCTRHVTIDGPQNVSYGYEPGTAKTIHDGKNETIVRRTQGKPVKAQNRVVAENSVVTENRIQAENSIVAENNNAQPEAEVQEGDDNAAAMAIGADRGVFQNLDGGLSPFAADAEMEGEIQTLIEGMTLEEKIGQMIMLHHGPGAQGPPGSVGENYLTFEMLRDFNIGLLKNRVKSNDPRDWVDRAEALQGRFWDTNTSVSFKGIPALWFVEASHGFSASAWGTIMPHNIGLGCANDLGLMERIGNVTAREVSATGLDATVSVSVTVPRNNRWGRVYEGFSQDPQTTAELAHYLIKGLQGEPGETDGPLQFLGPGKVVASAKHFIGDGATEFGIDGGDTVLEQEELIAHQGLPYKAAIQAGVQVMLVTKGMVNGEYVHGSHALLTDLLKDQWGFDGFLYSDRFGYTNLNGCAVDNCPTAINAGIDAFMIPFWWNGVAMITNTATQVRDGVISEDRIDDAVRRILRVKWRNRMLRQQPNRRQPPSARSGVGKARETPGGVGSLEHRYVAQEAVRKSMILLKNKNSVLPMRKKSKVLVTGNGADSMVRQCGSWTVTWQGHVEEHQGLQGHDTRSITGSDDYPPTFTDDLLPNQWFQANGATTIKEGLTYMSSPDNGTIVFSRNASAIDDSFDYAVVVLGEEPFAEWTGDVHWPKPLSYEFTDEGKVNVALLNTIKEQATKVPLIVVLLTGRPQYVNPQINTADAFVVAWLPGSEGVGVAQVLYGDYDFHGRLSFGWPLHGCLDGEPAKFETPYPLGYRHTYADGPLDVMLRECSVEECSDIEDGCIDFRMIKDDSVTDNTNSTIKPGNSTTRESRESPTLTTITNETGLLGPNDTLVDLIKREADDQGSSSERQEGDGTVEAQSYLRIGDWMSDDKVLTLRIENWNLAMFDAPEGRDRVTALLAELTGSSYDAIQILHAQEGSLILIFRVLNETVDAVFRSEYLDRVQQYAAFKDQDVALDPFFSTSMPMSDVPKRFRVTDPDPQHLVKLPDKDRSTTISNETEDANDTTAVGGGGGGGGGGGLVSESEDESESVQERQPPTEEAAPAIKTDGAQQAEPPSNSNSNSQRGSGSSSRSSDSQVLVERDSKKPGDETYTLLVALLSTGLVLFVGVGIAMAFMWGRYRSAIEKYVAGAETRDGCRTQPTTPDMINDIHRGGGGGEGGKVGGKSRTVSFR
ncbi:unnamed protein product [Vitrella brassicaformis CCMP3155]|uniref:Fibronectin type III-like domain-containing protein n=4 Tax=Vitrella brassicaformis TaxID=1169539 RepID=A0A0G4FZ04_VITBC|nr:unnamed protein product [Vitrella brassicaformis CCMP3155]|eukprot:CEM20314.1 unnamed protein product [Vitrella brassicaformis CCMP3155]